MMHFLFTFWFRSALAGFKPILAQLQQLKEGFGTALVLVFFIGFFWGVFKIWAGANAISKGDSEGKGGILAGIIIAAAAAIMGALFTIFGMQDAIITPRF
jgi:TRAP-type C4-dicarboxylate transport system permease small subunit